MKDMNPGGAHEGGNGDDKPDKDYDPKHAK